jgi:hypothetical protein
MRYADLSITIPLPMTRRVRVAGRPRGARRVRAGGGPLQAAPRRTSCRSAAQNRQAALHGAFRRAVRPGRLGIFCVPRMAGPQPRKTHAVWRGRAKGRHPAAGAQADRRSVPKWRKTSHRRACASPGSRLTWPGQALVRGRPQQILREVGADHGARSRGEGRCAGRARGPALRPLFFLLNVQPPAIIAGFRPLNPLPNAREQASTVRQESIFVVVIMALSGSGAPKAGKEAVAPGRSRVQLARNEGAPRLDVLPQARNHAVRCPDVCDFCREAGARRDY